MAYFGGTLLAAPIVKGDSILTWPTHHSVLGGGGYMEFACPDSRNSTINVGGTLEYDGMQSGQRRYGMLTYIACENKLYQLLPCDTFTTYSSLNSSQKIAALADNNNWKLFKTGTFTGTTNGISVYNNTCVGLGGALTTDTTICGDKKYNLCLTDLLNYTQNGSTTYINSGIVALQSTPNVSSTNFENGIGILMNYAGNSFSIYDNRTIDKKAGIEYAADYSEYFKEHSLVTKKYVDNSVTALSPKEAVIAASTSNQLLSSLGSGLTIDGVTIPNNGRVLLKNQTNKIENGIYIYNSALGTLIRSDDFDGTPDSEIKSGSYMFVLSGITNANTSWILTTSNPISINETPLTFQMFSKILNINAGSGICIDTINGSQNISLKLSAKCGLSLSGDGLSVNSEIASGGLCYDIVSAKICTNVSVCGPGPYLKIYPILDTTTNKLFVDMCEINSQLNSPLNCACNGLSSANKTVCLGGNLTQNTEINGDNKYDFSLNNLKSFNLSFSGNTTITDIANCGGLKYAADYTSSFTDYSLITKKYVNDCLKTKLNCNYGTNTQVLYRGATCIEGNDNFTYSNDTLKTPSLCISTVLSSGDTDNDIILVRENSTGLIKGVTKGSLVTASDSNNRYSYCVLTKSSIISSGSSAYVYLINNAISATTITLPASPPDGYAIKIKDISGCALNKVITINTNGLFIDDTQTVGINTNFGSLEIMYSSSLSKWFALGFINQ